MWPISNRYLLIRNECRQTMVSKEWTDRIMMLSVIESPSADPLSFVITISINKIVLKRNRVDP